MKRVIPGLLVLSIAFPAVAQEGGNTGIFEEVPDKALFEVDIECAREVTKKFVGEGTEIDADSNSFVAKNDGALREAIVRHTPVAEGTGRAHISAITIDRPGSGMGTLFLNSTKPPIGYFSIMGPEAGYVRADIVHLEERLRGCPRSLLMS